MRIHDLVPDLLVARGLSRRHASALLRAVQNYEDDVWDAFEKAIDINDVLHDLAHAMGCDHMTLQDRELLYDAAIAKGVALRTADRSRQSIHELRVTIDGEIPATTISALQDQPLGRLVDHPLLPTKTAIQNLIVGDGVTIAGISPRKSSIAIVARATQMDMAILRWRLWIKRRRDVWRSGAAEGLTPLTILIAMCFVSAAVFTTVIAPAVTAPMLIVCAATIAWRMGRKDKSLEDRLWDMRYRRLVDRRASILEGRRE